MNCPECSAEVPRGWLRCAQCGHAIAGVELRQTIKPSGISGSRLDREQPSKVLFFSLTILVIICSTAIYGIIKYNNAYAAKDKINVEFGIEPQQKDGQLEILGTTNLPDGTALVMVLSSESYSSEATVKVVNGSFSRHYSLDGKRLEVGLYNLSIYVSAVMQDAAVQKQIGKNGEMLYGAYVAKKPGNIVNFAKTVQVD